MRARFLNKKKKQGGVIYWMSRDQRVNDNWALVYADRIAKERKLEVVFCLAPKFLEATASHYAFMIEGLKQVEASLAEKGIPFTLLKGHPEKEIIKFAEEKNIGTIVTDFDPLKIKIKWKMAVAKGSASLVEIDTHNIVPCWYASKKQEYSAATFRPKLKESLRFFLTEFPLLRKRKRIAPSASWPKTSTSKLQEYSIKPGERAALHVLHSFVGRLDSYKYRNDPNANATSCLSPYLHFGQISAQRVAIEVMKSNSPEKEKFLDELIVRRELAENFCFYNRNYDNFFGFPAWAQRSLNKHRNDIREYTYTLKEFELARTHDPLWNAAQNEMVKTGRMHGYMRMYWAKKMLEWTDSPETAQKIAIILNDRYELDGRDPNGYTGIAWSIGGLHDRPWGERAVFGNVRYMSIHGYMRKFDVGKYITANTGV
ncbi:MAG: deoxyribodipyrimidine photo-lyase [Candidatus Woesearchaeota archaeon]